MPTEYDFTTLARAATRLRVSTGDAELPALITAASQALSDWLGYPAHLREGVEETVPSEGKHYLFLRAGVVRRVESITVGGVEVPAEEYAVDAPRVGRIVRRRGRWPFTGEWSVGAAPLPLVSRDTGEVVVTFDSGWRTPGQVALALEVDPSSDVVSDLPAPLEEAALLIITAWYRRLGMDLDVTTKGLGAASISWGADSLRGGKTALPLPAQLMASPYYKQHRRRQS